MKRRETHVPTDSLVLFQIGMRINKPWRIDAWLPTFFAMPPMLRELSRDAEHGILGYRLLFGEGGATVVAWFRTVEDAYRYANADHQQHRPAWLDFLRRSRKSPGAVGIWHETYEVARAETFYGDMPPSGLGKAVGTQPITRGSESARDRMKRRNGVGAE